MNKIFIPFAFILLSLVACQRQAKEQENANNTTPVELPKTPEAVVRTWEDQINKNQFNAARLISAGATLDLVNSLAESDSIEHSGESRSEIVSIKCSENGDEATCNCVVKDEWGTINYLYYLVRNKGQWFLNDVKPQEEKTSAKISQSSSNTL